MSCLSTFENEFYALKKTLASENIDEMFILLNFYENNKFISQNKVIDCVMEIMKYIIEVLNVNLIEFTNAEDTIWEIIKNIETNKGKICKKSLEWNLLKNDIIECLDYTFNSYNNLEEEMQNDDDDKYYEEYNEYECESWESMDMM